MCVRTDDDGSPARPLLPSPLTLIHHPHARGFPSCIAPRPPGLIHSPHQPGAWRRRRPRPETGAGEIEPRDLRQFGRPDAAGDAAVMGRVWDGVCIVGSWGEVKRGGINKRDKGSNNHQGSKSLLVLASFSLLQASRPHSKIKVITLRRGPTIMLLRCPPHTPRAHVHQKWGCSPSSHARKKSRLPCPNRRITPLFVLPPYRTLIPSPCVKGRTAARTPAG